MSRIDTLRDSFSAATKTYAWSDFVTFLRLSGYEQMTTGRTAGSRRRFHNKTLNHYIRVHEPHDGEMTRSMIKGLQDNLRDVGVI